MINLEAEIQQLDQDIQAQFSSSMIYAFSPIAKIELDDTTSNFIITITDKWGTTTAEVPNLTQDKINHAIQVYLQSHPIIQEHDQSEDAHAYIRGLIDKAVQQIPTKISQLENDSGYVSNFKELIVAYDSFLEFPNIPSDQEKDMVFLDKSTGDMYIFGVNNSLSYSPFGVANNDIIYGGDSTER